MKKALSKRLFPLKSESIFLRQGAILKHGGIVFQISEFNTLGVVLENMEDHTKKIVSENILIEKIQSLEIHQVEIENEIYEKLNAKTKNAVELRQESDSSVKVMIEKTKWLDEIEKKGIIKLKNTARVRSIINILSSTTMLGYKKYEISTLANANTKYLASGRDPISLLPSFSGRGGAGKTRLHPEIEEIIENELKSTQEKVGRVIKQHVIDDMRTKVQELIRLNPNSGLRLPGDSTFSRRFDNEMSEYAICVRNEGKRRADRLFRNNGARITASHPLEVVEYDDIDTGVFMIDNYTKLPIGRGYLTSGIDQYTLVILGYSIGHEHRSSQSAIHAITDSLLPKDTSLEVYRHLSHPWIGYGTAGINILDNPTYNHSDETLRVQLKLQQAAAWSRPYQPGDKSCIEHFNHIVKNTFNSRIPGWRKNKDNEFGHRTGIDEAIISIQEYRRKFVEWVTSEYSHHPGVNGTTPHQRWMKYYQTHRPVVFYTKEQIGFIRMTPSYTTLRASGGVLSLKLRYNSDELERLRKHIGHTAKVVIYTHEDDLSYILVEHPHTKNLINAKCLENENYIRGLTRRQQQLILKKVRLLGVSNPAWSDCVCAREILEKETEALARDKRLRKRNFATINAMPEKTPNSSGKQEISPQNKSNLSEKIVTDIEYSIFQLDQIQIENDESWE